MSGTTRPRTEPRAWQRMLSGRRLDLLNPSPLDVELSDIAHGLARVARWNGQTNGDHAFSVAQHSLVVEAIFRRQNRCDADECLMALLHDAPEYVIGDMISPFKAVVGGGYKTVEKRLEAAVHLRFGLPLATPAALKAKIKKADQIAAFFEATELAGFSRAEATKFFGAPRGITLDVIELAPVPAVEAQRRFAERFATLERERGQRAAVGVRMGTIIVAPLGKIAELAVRHRCREMLSLVAPRHDFHRPAVIPAARHLIVGVNDIAFAGTGTLVAPSDAHVSAIIDFAGGWDRQAPLLVHCMMGVSRSPAAALIAALVVEPDQDDNALAQRLRRASVQATPNARLIEIGDHMLSRNGRLVAAVKAIGRGADYVGDSPFIFSAIPETAKP